MTKSLQVINVHPTLPKKQKMNENEQYKTVINENQERNQAVSFYINTGIKTCLYVLRTRRMNIIREHFSEKGFA